MDYEKKYNEALERAEQWIKDGCEPSTKKCLELIFPQLRESEYERIRKILIEVVNITPASIAVRNKRELLDWLEKQKERNTAEKQDYSGLNDPERAILRGFLCAGVENVPVGIVKETAKDCIAHFPWPTKWSEEDERILKGIIGKIDHDQTYEVSKAEMLSFLKSLRSQPHWKPSERQLTKLYCIAEGIPDDDDAKVLKELYEQLKKL